MDRQSARDPHRYARQIQFCHLGADGQERLARARVTVVGMGALGSFAATELARAGVGFIRCIDRDIVELSNLQRQTLYEEEDAFRHRPKAEAAARALSRANSAIRVESVVQDLAPQNAEALLGDVDLIVDGTDNFQTRYLINDISVKHGIPWVYGGAVSSYGMAGLFRPGGPDATSCLVCLFGENGENGGEGQETCDVIGVIAPIVAIIASLQVAEALKWLTGRTEALARGLICADVWSNTYRTMAFPPPRPDCPCCARGQFAALHAAPGALTVSFCGRRTIQVKPPVPRSLVMKNVAVRLAQVGSVTYTGQLLRLDLGEEQISLFADGRALIHGVDDPARARSLYDRYIGT